MPRQVQKALDHANEVRLARARIRRDVKARLVTAMDVLAAPSEAAARMTVIELLMCVPRVGRDKAVRAMQYAQIPSYRLVSEISEKQREALATVLPRAAGGGQPPRDMYGTRARIEYDCTVPLARCTFCGEQLYYHAPVAVVGPGIVAHVGCLREAGNGRAA